MGIGIAEAKQVTEPTVPRVPLEPAAGAASTRRRRVIFINRFFFPDISATSQILSDLARALASPEYELHVICSRQLYGQARAQLPREDSWEGVRIHRCWSARFGRDRLFGRALDYLSFFGAATLSMLRWTRRGDVLIAMTDPPMISVCAALVAKARRATLINWLQDVFPEIASALEVTLPPGVPSVLKAARNWSLQVAQQNVVLGASMRRFLCRLGVSAKRQRIIENWGDDAVTPRPARWSTLRQSLNIPERTFVVQYSGNLGRAHEFRTLLAAAEDLRDEPDWLFLFVGGGANMQLLQAEAQHRGLTNLRFLPYQPRAQLGDSLAAGDVHVTCLLPSLEGLIVPSKFYGILAAGRPVIAIGDPDGEQARIVRAEDCGAVVSCGDGIALVDQLRHMRADPDWVRAAGLRARSLYERKYTPAAAAEKWRSVLQAASAA